MNFGSSFSWQRQLLGFLLAAFTAATSATGLPRHGIFVYSNLCIEDESDDTAGQRITLLRFDDGDKLIYEYTEGALSYPLFADKVKIDSSGHTVSFTVLTGQGTQQAFEGRFSDGARSLTFIGDWCGKSTATIRLPRIIDFHRKREMCKPCPNQAG